MNIEQAKNEIRNALKVYLLKNSHGNYEVSTARQRPLMIIGAPGIGKTAIVQQLALEMDLGLVSYTITHHTRQSAIGLPYISKKVYDGKEVMVTEYTMSEIIMSVYEAIENQGKKEGILFIDEINCVSETLAPAMLDLLQNKKFGPHSIPQGWILIAAGNPPEYNRSAREFDVVTLDRLKILNVEPDFEIWEKYAYKNLVHDAVIYYLSMRHQNIFHSERTVGGYNYVTPRGWEDLSVAIQKYEKLGIEITLPFIEQYIADKRTATEFFNYYSLFAKYKQDYNVTAIMNGEFGDFSEKVQASRFDEKLGVISVFSGAVNQEAEEFFIQEVVGNYFITKYESCRKEKIAKEDLVQQMLLENFKTDIVEDHLIIKKRNAIIDEIKRFASLKTSIKDFADEWKKTLKLKENQLRTHVENLLTFSDMAFGKGQEMVSFVLNLIASYYFVHFLSLHPLQMFYDYNELLLVDKQNKLLIEEIARYKSSF